MRRFQIGLQFSKNEEGKETSGITTFNVKFGDPLAILHKRGEILVQSHGFLNQQLQIVNTSQLPALRQKIAFQVFLDCLLQVKGDNRQRAVLCQ